MIKYIYNSDGYYVAYIYDGVYCFSDTNEYIGFMNGIYLYDYKGKYIGYLTSDDRIIRNKYEKRPNIIPISKPMKPLKPLKPLKRYRMSSLGSGYIDVFLHKNTTIDYEIFDDDYSKYLNTKLYASNGKFLGNINLNKFDSNSIANPYGNFGSQYSSDSVFNKYGDYGSPYSILSPFNKYSTYPLLIKNKNNEIVAKISDNNYIDNVISATEFFNWFKDKVD